MPTHAAFLRGVNLGSRRRVSGAELRSAFDALGFRDVHPFRTSGNVAFDAGRESLTRMAARIEGRLEESLGYAVAVFLRTASDLRDIAGSEPFDRAAIEASTGKLQVAFLSSKPSTSSRKEVSALATDEDMLAFGHRELYWLPSGGIRDSRLDMKAIERALGPATLRTMGTVEQMAAKYFAT